MNLLKCFYNGKTIEENNLHGNTGVHVLRTLGDRPFCATFRESYACADDREFPVFVRVGNISKDLSPIASVERLKSSYYINVVSTETSKMDHLSPVPNIPDPFGESFRRIFDRKLCELHDLLGIKASQLINEII